MTALACLMIGMWIAGCVLMLYPSENMLLKTYFYSESYYELKHEAG